MNNRLKHMIRFAKSAAIKKENLRPDGSVNWDFVSADLHILCGRPNESKWIDEVVIPIAASKFWD